MNRSETIAKLASALVNAQAEMGNAVKDSKNPFFKSKYADLNAVREACMPALNKHKISVIQPTTVIDGKLYVETMLLHESGEFLSGLYEVVVAKQNDPQALGAAISYSRRYGLQSLVNIGAEDDDAESAVNRGSKNLVDKADSVVQNVTSATTKAPIKETMYNGANVDLEQNPQKKPNSAPASRGSFRKNPAPAATEEL